MTDILDCTDLDNVTLNGKPFSVPEGFNYVSPVKTNYYAAQCVSCTGWAHGTFSGECSTCSRVNLQKQWLENHRKRYSEEVLQEMVAAYRIKCDTGNVGPIRDWCMKYLVDPQSENRL